MLLKASTRNGLGWVRLEWWGLVRFMTEKGGVTECWDALHRTNSKKGILGSSKKDVGGRQKSKAPCRTLFLELEASTELLRTFKGISTVPAPFQAFGPVKLESHRSQILI